MNTEPEYRSLSENVYIEIEDDGKTVKIEIYRRNGDCIGMEELTWEELATFERIIIEHPDD